MDPQWRQTGGPASRTGAQTSGGRSPVPGLGHRSAAPLAAGQLAAGGAGQQPGPALAVEDAHHPAVAADQADQPGRVQPGAGVVAAAVDTSSAAQPARSTSGSGDQRRPGPSQQLDGRQGETTTHGTPARRARSAATTQAFQVGACSCCSPSSWPSRTTTAARSGHGAHAAARAPMTTAHPAAAWAHSRGTTRDRQPGGAGGASAGRGGRRRDDQGRAPPGGGQHDRQQIGGRRHPQHAARPPKASAISARPRPALPSVDRPARPDHVPAGGRPGRRQAGSPAPRPGDAVFRNDGPAPGPAPCRPPGQVDHLGRRPPTGHLGQRAQGHPRGRLDVVGHDPAADPAAVQVDADHGADPTWSAKASGTR